MTVEPDKLESEDGLTPEQQAAAEAEAKKKADDLAASIKTDDDKDGASTPDPKPDDKKEDDLPDELDIKLPEIPEPVKTGDELMDGVQEALYSQGFNATEIINAFVEDKVTQEQESKLREKFGGMYFLLKNQAQAAHANAKIKTQKTAEGIYKFLGADDVEKGKALWQKAIEFVGSGHSGITEEGLAEIKQLIGAGGSQANAAALMVVTQMSNSDWFKQNSSEPLIPNDTGKGGSADEGFITMEEYDIQSKNAYRDGDTELADKLFARLERTLEWQEKNNTVFKRQS